MPINRQFSPDFAKAEICDFTVYGGDVYSEVDAKQNERIQAGYRPAGPVRDLPDLNLAVAFPTYIRRFAKLFTRHGKLIREQMVEDYGFARGTVSAQAILSIKVAGLQPGQEQEIVDAFSNTQLDWMHIDDAENALIRTGVGIEQYQVDFVPLITIAERLELSANFRQFMQVMTGLRDSQGRQIYHVEEIDKVERGCVKVEPQFPEGPIVEVPDPAHLEDRLKQRADEGNPECDGLTTTIVDLGVAFKIFETKIEYTVDEIRICGVKIGETKLPHAYWKQRDVTLVGIVASLESVKQVAEQAFQSCMRDAAIGTAILTMVTSAASLASAVTVFVAYVQQCLTQKLNRDLHCIAPDLALITGPDPGWTPV